MAAVKRAFLFAFSWLALLGERLWARFWIVASVLFVWAGLVLLWRAPPLFLLAVALAAAFLAPAPRFTWPRRAEVWRRMERAGGITHQPLQALHDDAAAGNTTLWQAHQQHAQTQLANLRPYLPHTGVAQRDRFGLRYIALGFLLLGFVFGTPARLRDALKADFRPASDAVALDLWIEPPAYTHLPVSYLATAQKGLLRPAGDGVSVPEGSVLKLRIAGPRFAPRVSFAGAAQKISAAGNRSYMLDLPLRRNGTLALRTAFFAPLAAWPLSVTPDGAPSVNLLRIEATSAAATKITFTAADDYGVTKMAGLVSAGGDSFRFDILPPAGAEDTHIEDLARNPHAGETASLTLEAEDAAGHKSLSAPISFTLPERVFEHPVARQVAQQRKILLADRGEAARKTAADSLAHIAMQPGLYYDGSTGIYLSLVSAIRRIMAAEDVSELLWDIAADLEDGGLSAAQGNLRDALGALSAALNDPALSREKLQALLEDVRQKAQAYAQALAQDLERQSQLAKDGGGDVPALSPDLARRFAQNIDIGKMFAQMDALLRSPARQDMRQMAGALRDMLGNIDMHTGESERQKQMQTLTALQGIEDILHAQQSLYDRINKTGDEGDPKEGAAAQKEQLGILGRLGAAARTLGGLAPVPENIGAAQAAMARAAGALGRGDTSSALAAQKEALDRLQEGLDEAVKTAAQSLMPMGLGKTGAGSYDPLGRETGLNDNGSVKLPDERQIRRVQQIMNELRRRSNEQDRSRIERDYIDRLLDGTY